MSIGDSPPLSPALLLLEALQFKLKDFYQIVSSDGLVSVCGCGSLLSETSLNNPRYREISTPAIRISSLCGLFFTFGRYRRYSSIELQEIKGAFTRYLGRKFLFSLHINIA